MRYIPERCVIIFTGLGGILLASLLTGCDQFREDGVAPVAINESATDYYVPEDASVLISLRAVIMSASQKISVKISKVPKRGRLTQIGNYFLRYKPDLRFHEQIEMYGDTKDNFEVTFFDDGTTLRRQVITVHVGQYTSDFPCALYAVEDVVKSKPNAEVKVRGLLNDRLCDINVENVQTLISLYPEHGEAEMRGDTIVYKPKTDFMGVDEMIYEATATHQQNIKGKGPLVSYGLVTINVEE